MQLHYQVNIECLSRHGILAQCAAVPEDRVSWIGRDLVECKIEQMCEELRIRSRVGYPVSALGFRGGNKFLELCEEQRMRQNCPAPNLDPSACWRRKRRNLRGMRPLLILLATINALASMTHPSISFPRLPFPF